MVNIFQETQELDISIADVISESSGFPVDSLPKLICLPCCEDAANAFEIKKTYERSHYFFCQMEEDRVAKAFYRTKDQEEDNKTESSTDDSDDGDMFFKDKDLHKVDKKTDT